MSASEAELANLASAASVRPQALPRLGFVGVGWIGALRLRAVAEAGCADVVGVADLRRAAADQALEHIAPLCPRATAFSFEELLEAGLDGIVIATPNSEHAPQALASLEHGLHVFCQKPLARTRDEVSRIIECARANDRLLDVDFCYRNVAGVREMKSLIGSGAIGRVYEADLTFHNAYGPDKPWFFDARRAGGGCMMDLGIHLIDLAFWLLDFPKVHGVSSRRYRNGQRLRPGAAELESYAAAEVDFGDVTARMACSWHLHAGCDAVIEATFFGTAGALRLRNLKGSFFDFTVEHCEGTKCRTLASSGREWGAAAICDWASRVGTSPSFDPMAAHVEDVHAVLDEIYRQ